MLQGSGVQMHNLKAGAIYFALVFAVGWILGPIRQLLIVPHLGHITGLLLELPLMLVTMIFAARWVLRRPNVPHALRTRAQIGVVALGILLPARSLQAPYGCAARRSENIWPAWRPFLALSPSCHSWRSRPSRR